MHGRICRVLETALYCDTLRRTADFYMRLLDTRPMLDSARLVALDAGGGTVLLLFQRGYTNEPLETSEGTIPPHDGSGPTHVAFAVDIADISAWETRLTALGVEVESRVSWSRGGRSLYFRDPDGHSIELATPGTWPNY
jgi:catechol 2,3-dioxygenase-like lactoylglutathione lyase family enzyme